MKDVFKKVHLSDKKKLLRRVIDEQIVWLVKTETSEVQQLLPKQILEEKIMECAFLPGKDFNLKNSEMAVISINSGEDKYFFYGLMTFSATSIYIDVQGDLFYLQRRKSARLELPENYITKCKVLDHKGNTLPFDFTVIDISSGGCRLSLNTLEPIIKAGTILNLKITLGHQTPFEVQGEVRHTKPIKDSADLPQMMGIQYVNNETTFEAKMLNLYMDVQREIFLKHIKK
jgi:hypothetical protein